MADFLLLLDILFTHIVAQSSHIKAFHSESKCRAMVFCALRTSYSSCKLFLKNHFRKVEDSQYSAMRLHKLIEFFRLREDDFFFALVQIIIDNNAAEAK